jgi:hypothetical protein
MEFKIKVRIHQTRIIRYQKQDKDYLTPDKENGAAVGKSVSLWIENLQIIQPLLLPTKC